MVTSRELDDILSIARTESARLGHFYVGVEHLFVALTKVKGGVTAAALEDQEVAPRFARYLVRQEVGQGDGRRFWPGFRQTPRLQTVLKMAHDIGLQSSRVRSVERDLLLAILREADSLPVRVLQQMDLDLDRLEVEVASWSGKNVSASLAVPVELSDGVALGEEEQRVLRHMFRQYARVTVDRRLEGGYTRAQVLVATPYRADGRPDASVIVKLDDRQAILYEKMRYDSYVRDTLPPATARVLDNPVVPDHSALGGLKYTFVRKADEARPVDLVEFAAANSPDAFQRLLTDGLFHLFGETWWKQRHLYQFGVWQEYEMLLPPAIVVEMLTNYTAATRRLTPPGHWSRRGRFAPDEVVQLEGFVVQDFYPDRQAIKLVAGAGPEAQNRSGKIEVRGVDAPSSTFYRGAVIESLIGRVVYTRDDLLYQQVVALQPEFDLNEDRLEFKLGSEVALPNPLTRYRNLLQRRVTGTLSTIHGDLHLRNVLVGPGGSAWLIDFAETREGHTLFDWAVLETSILTEIVAPLLQGEDWSAVYPVINALMEGGAGTPPSAGGADWEQALKSVWAVRGIVAQCLCTPGEWGEYYLALALIAMRGLRWTSIPVQGRRLLFMVAALSMAFTVSTDPTKKSAFDTDATDVNIRLPQE